MKAMVIFRSTSHDGVCAARVQGLVKLKAMRDGTEEDVRQEDLVQTLKDRLQALGPISIIASRLANTTL
jgi:hypothetical protein